MLGLAVWSMVAHGWGWLYGLGVHPYPESSSTPWTYQLLSGLVPALTVLSLLTFLATAFRHLNCHTAGCYRLGKFPVVGGQFKVCRKHHREITGHPDKLTVDALRELHLAHHARTPDPGVQQT